MVITTIVSINNFNSKPTNMNGKICLIQTALESVNYNFFQCSSSKTPTKENFLLAVSETPILAVSETNWHSANFIPSIWMDHLLAYDSKFVILLGLLIYLVSQNIGNCSVIITHASFPSNWL